MEFISECLKAIAVVPLLVLVSVVSFIIVELARDIWHFSSHDRSKFFQLLRKLHKYHHAITKGKQKDFSNLDIEKYKSSQWFNDVPESLVMTVVSTIFPWLIFIFTPR